MTKKELNERTDAVIANTKTALQTLWDNINKGQQKQLLKVEEIKTLLDRYGVSYSTK